MYGIQPNLAALILSCCILSCILYCMTSTASILLHQTVSLLSWPATFVSLPPYTVSRNHLPDSHPTCPAPVLSLFLFVLCPYCPASVLSCVRFFLHSFYSASILSCIRFILHPFCPSSVLFCIHFFILHLFYSAPFVLHPFYSASILSCIRFILHPCCTSSVLCCIRFVLHPFCAASVSSSIGPFAKCGNKMSEVKERKF